MLLNLLSNAVKFTRDGVIRMRVVETQNGGATGLRFEVADNGIGISDQARHRLFNAFSQVDGTISRRFGGTGLGLAICKKIVESLGGRIGVESASGVGSCFWFEMPAQRTIAPSKAAESGSVAAAQLPRRAVLVVEDNHVNQTVARQFLERLGQAVTVAGNGQEAVDHVESRRFDLVLMDMQMPVMDGIEATLRIRALPNGASVPIVAMTANASDDDRTRCREAGMNGFDPKPISMARLSALIGLYATAGPAEERNCAGCPADGDEEGDADLAGQDRRRIGELRGRARTGRVREPRRDLRGRCRKGARRASRRHARRRSRAS